MLTSAGQAKDHTIQHLTPPKVSCRMFHPHLNCPVDSRQWKSADIHQIPSADPTQYPTRSDVPLPIPISSLTLYMFDLIHTIR